MKNLWSKRPIIWEDSKYRYCSVVFSWDLVRLISRYKEKGPKTGKQIIIGGPATKILSHVIPKEMIVKNNLPSLYRHNPFATKTSKGCIRKCPFCIVAKAEGTLVELKNWEVKPIVIDNNLLACSQKHFDSVIDKLKKLSWCDFNQGLDIRLLKKYHAERFAELRKPVIRLSFDNIKLEKHFLNAYQLLLNAKIARYKIRVYVLIGYNDTPEDALYRLELIRKLKVWPAPMRYQPINTLKRNDYVNENWSNKELVRFMRYWQNLRITSSVPFSEFKYG